LLFRINTQKCVFLSRQLTWSGVIRSAEQLRIRGFELPNPEGLMVRGFGDWNTSNSIFVHATQCARLVTSKAVAKLFLSALVLFFSVSCATISTEAPELADEPTKFIEGFQTSFTSRFERLAEIQDPAKRVENSFSLNFGPQLLSVKASYLEKSESIPAITVDSPQPSLRRYLNLVGSTSFGGTNLSGEGELTYGSGNTFPGDCDCLDWPRMMRLGIKTRWQGLRYGADLKSVEKGFVAISGAQSTEGRDEGQLWGEYSLGPFNLRSSVAESWEELIDANRHRVTRAATTAVQLNRSVWSGTITSSYGLVEQGPDLNQETTIFSNRLAGLYRPFSVLSLGPSIGIKHEWDTVTGSRTESPTTEFAIVYTPLQDKFRLIGGTSFTRTFNRYALTDVMIIGTRAIMDWKIGNFLGRDDTLSFNVNYNRQRDLIATGNSFDQLSGILQLKISGF
jgi:hypothetical protein